MLNIIFQDDMTEKEAERLSGRKWLQFPDDQFHYLSNEDTLSDDLWFIKALKDIDRCDIPMKCVARDLITGRTHSFDRISTGVKMVWLMRYHADKFLFPSQYLGENCYQCVLDASTCRNDIFLYDDSDMLYRESQGYCLDACTGLFNDYVKNKIVELNGNRKLYIASDYGCDREDIPNVLSFEYRTDIM